MAILEAVLSSEYLSQLVINRWHYIASGDPTPITNSFGLLSAMGFLLPGVAPTQFAADTIAAQLQNAANGSYNFRALYVRNLYDPTDFVETAFPTGVAGLAGGVAVSPFVAYGLTSTRVRTDIRRGQKRLAGVNEETMGAGGVLTGTVLSQLGYLATLMGDTLTYTTGGASLSFAPAVLQFEEYAPELGKKAYRPYALEADQLDHAAIGVRWSVKDRVRSQTSRQVGRGI